MYNPKRFKSEDSQEAFDLMDRYPFATLVSVVGEAPFISHLPLTPIKVENRIELIGHMARANPHSKVLAEKTVTVIFHGPHAYITPKWYTKNDVPTWNYSTIHVTGRVELIDHAQGIEECLKELTHHVERHWPSGWSFFVPDDLAGETLAKSIVGFKIKVDEFDFKKKLGQNRGSADFAGVMRGLESRGDDNSRAIREQMLELFSRMEEQS